MKPSSLGPLSREVQTPPLSVVPAVLDEDAVQLTDVIRFFRRQWRLIAVTALAAGALASILGVVLTSREYEATATLVLMPPRLASDLRPQLMSVQGFQRLLESDAVIDETIRRLVDSGLVREAESDLTLGVELRSRIYVSRQSEATPLAPVIEIIALGHTAEAAAATANTWADVFLKHVYDLQSGSTTANIGLVETQYHKSNDEVLALEAERLEAEETFGLQITEATISWNRKLDEVQVDWDRKIVDSKKETQDLLATFQLKTRERIEGFARSQGLAVAGATPLQAGDATAGSAPAPLGADAEALLLRIMTLRIRFAQELEFLSLEKAISNDALWQATVLSHSEILDLESLMAPTLLTQEINPVYTGLALHLSQIELELEELSPNDRESARRTTAGFEEVQRERSSGLAKLYAERAQSLDELQKHKSRELSELRAERQRLLDNLERQRDTRLQQLDRRLAQARQLLLELAGRYNQADLARGGQTLTDLRLAGSAAPPFEPQSRRILPKAVIGFLLGSLLGLLAAILREVTAE